MKREVQKHIFLVCLKYQRIPSRVQPHYYVKFTIAQAQPFLKRTAHHVATKLHILPKLIPDGTRFSANHSVLLGEEYPSKINHLHAPSPCASCCVRVMQDKGISNFVEKICTTLLTAMSGRSSLSGNRRMVREAEMPGKCGICRGGGELEVVMRRLRMKHEAEERALTDIKIRSPGFFGALCRGSLLSVDRRIEVSKEDWRREMEGLHEELRREQRVEW